MKLSVVSKRMFDSSSAKFIPKARAKSLGSLKVLKVQNEKVEEKIILNYRGVGISKRKLFNMLEDLFRLYETNYAHFYVEKEQRVSPIH